LADESVFAVFNPSAGRGRGGRRIEHFRELLRRHVGEVRYAVTSRPDEESELVDAALAAGCRTLVAAGGDGTWSKVADSLLKSGRSDVSLALLAGGTGNDFGKTFGISFESSEAVVRAIAAGRARRIDVGRCESRHFLNVVGIGFDIAVIADAAGMPVLKGDALYRFCALRQLFRFPGLELRIRDETKELLRADHLMLIIANARYFGGSFHIAPGADLTDGRLDLVAIRNVGPLARARLFRKVAQGRHAADENVEIVQGRRFEVSFTEPIQYEVDGDVYTASAESLTVEAVPAALNLIVPAGGATQTVLVRRSSD
jgi:diacylglycerol kinase (ATP)